MWCVCEEKTRLGRWVPQFYRLENVEPANILMIVVHVQGTQRHFVTKLYSGIALLNLVDSVCITSDFCKLLFAGFYKVTQMRDSKIYIHLKCSR